MNNFIISVGLLGGWVYLATRLLFVIAFIDIHQLRIRVSRECKRRGWPCRWDGVRGQTAFIAVSDKVLVIRANPTFFFVPVRQLLDEHAKLLAPSNQFGA